jgi:hypothetical protein
MFDPATISAALTSVKTIIGLLKNANDAQLAMTISSEIASLQGKLIDVQQQVLATQAESDELRAENNRLKATTFHHGVSWRARLEDTEDGPFCPICIAEGKDMRLMLRQHVDQTGASLHFQCPKSHGEQGAARDPVYSLPRELVPEGRYAARR